LSDEVTEAEIGAAVAPIKSPAYYADGFCFLKEALSA
jgi:hypothetical protein